MYTISTHRIFVVGHFQDLWFSFRFLGTSQTWETNGKPSGFCRYIVMIWKPIIYGNQSYMETNNIWKPKIYRNQSYMETNNIWKPKIYRNQSYMETNHIWKPIIYGNQKYIETNHIWKPIIWTPIIYGNLAPKSAIAKRNATVQENNERLSSGREVPPGGVQRNGDSHGIGKYHHFFRGFFLCSPEEMEVVTASQVTLAMICC